MKAQFKWGPHFVTLDDSEGVSCQDLELREYLDQWMEEVADGPTVSPVSIVAGDLDSQGLITDLNYFDVELIH